MRMLKNPEVSLKLERILSLKTVMIKLEALA